MKISVITVSLNSEKTIEKTINSVLSQNYKNFEYIIVDGKSDDKTLDVINKYKNKIDLVISEKDKGIFDAINKGIQRSSGDIISIIHSDDSFYDDKVLETVNKNFIEKDNLECLIGITLIKRKNSDFIVRKYNSSFFKKWMIYVGFTPPHPSTFIKKKVYDKIGFYKTDYEIAGDFDFFVRMFLKNKIIYKTINQNLVIMSMGGKSTKSIKSNLISNKEILRSFKQNNIYSNFLFILLRFPIKLIQFILK